MATKKGVMRVAMPRSTWSGYYPEEKDYRPNFDSKESTFIDSLTADETLCLNKYFKSTKISDWIKDDNHMFKLQAIGFLEFLDGD